MTANGQQRYYHNPRREMLRFVPGAAQRILDVGCFSGAFGEELKKSRTVEVWGVDPDAVAAAQARRVLDRVLCGYFDAQLDLPDAHFDAIVMNDVLEHMSDPWAALELAARKLKPGGKIVVSLPNLRQIDNLLHILFDKDFRYELNGIRDSTHLRFFTRKSAIRLLEECGLEVEHVEGICEQWWTRSIWRRIAFRLFARQLAETKYVQFALVAGIRPAN